MSWRCSPSRCARAPVVLRRLALAARDRRRRPRTPLAEEAGAVSTSTTTTSTTTTSTTTTTAPAPPGSTALSILDGDVQAALAAGTIDDATGSTVTEDAARAVNDAAAGLGAKARADLQQAGTALVTGSTTVRSLPRPIRELDGDLAALASALGVRPRPDDRRRRRPHPRRSRRTAGDRDAIMGMDPGSRRADRGTGQATRLATRRWR